MHDGERDRLGRNTNHGLEGGVEHDLLTALEARFRWTGPSADGELPSFDPLLEAAARELAEEGRGGLIEAPARILCRYGHAVKYMRHL